MSRLKLAILPTFLFLCLILGGSSRGVVANMVLQVTATLILAWALLSGDPPAMTSAARRLLLIVAAVGLLFVVQLLPLPPAMWTALPGRDFLVRGYALLGMPQPWMPLSLSPYDTMASALTLLPPLALFLAMLRLRSWRAEHMFLGLLGGTGVSILLGILQVRSGVGWYFYDITNRGVAVGAFANANHFATLLLIAIPVFCAVAVDRWREWEGVESRPLAVVVSAVGLAFLLAGILMCRSAAFLLLGPPVVAATVLMAFRLKPKRMGQGLVAVALLVVLAGSALVFAGDRIPGWGTSASVETRKQYWATSVDAAQGQALTGWGFGAFQQAYRRYEDASAVDRFYVNHAHNDYAEIAVEGGIPALLLVLVFLGWWVAQSWSAWKSPGAMLVQKAASIASAAILMHSFFDFPLRTAAISACLAVCLALLAGARGAAKLREEDRPRHATL